MSMLKTLASGALLAVFLIAAPGCDVESKYPLSDEKTSTPDVKLLGHWKEEGNDEKEGWRIAKHPKSDNVLMAFMLPAELDNSCDLLFTTAIDGKKYLSWGGYDPQRETTGFFICRYEMPDENTLKVYFLSIDAMRKAITENRLMGKIKMETYRKTEGARTLSQRETVRLTAETKDLRDFLAGNADSCFPKDRKADMVFSRVK